MLTREMSAIIRAALTDGDAPSTGLVTSTMTEPYWDAPPNYTSQN
jgi:hypothetical protein